MTEIQNREKRRDEKTKKSKVKSINARDTRKRKRRDEKKKKSYGK